MITLAASLRNKAKSVLISFKDTETLDLKTLLEKLEARFGEHLGSSSYSLLRKMTLILVSGIAKYNNEFSHLNESIFDKTLLSYVSET